jgi:hypothetical protein
MQTLRYLLILPLVAACGCSSLSGEAALDWNAVQICLSNQGNAQLNERICDDVYFQEHTETIQQFLQRDRARIKDGKLCDASGRQYYFIRCWSASYGPNNPEREEFLQKRIELQKTYHVVVVSGGAKD